MIFPSVFPSLFSETAAVSANFTGGVTVQKTEDPKCVILSGHTPIGFQTWLFRYLAAKGYNHTVVERIEFRWSSDGACYVWEK